MLTLQSASLLSGEGTFVGSLIITVGVLAGTVAYLFGVYRSGNVKQLAGIEKRLMKCEEDRRDLWKHVFQLESLSCTDRTCVKRAPLQPLPLRGKEEAPEEE